jgi:hypothetical protein
MRGKVMEWRIKRASAAAAVVRQLLLVGCRPCMHALAAFIPQISGRI